MLTTLHIVTKLRVLQASKGACITDTGAIGGRLLGVVTLSGQALTIQGTEPFTQSVQG